MAHSRCIAFVCVILFSCVFVDARSKRHSGLSDDYYRYKCPEAESVIAHAANAAFFNASNPLGIGLTASFLRMAFHDCFVKGCDGSIFLDGADTEKTADVNKRLFGFEVIDNIKAAVEAVCPGVVSCADIMQYVARDGVVALNGTRWEVEGGRKDGLVSSAKAAEKELPPPDFAVSQLIASFARRGLSKSQMVILSGSHTIGVGHCDILQKRLYAFSKTQSTDPSIDSAYAQFMKQTCPKNNATTNADAFILMDVLTPLGMDSGYYKTLEQKKGLFTSDQSLYDDIRTKSIVESLTDNELFLQEFGQAMRAMGRVGVKVKGEVRKICSKVNGY